MIIEVHAIQTFGPSNLNRDDTGNPKDSPFGGVRRARISSQSAKRAMRTSEIFKNTILSHPLGTRTKTIVRQIVLQLIQENMDEDLAWEYAEYVVTELLAGLSTTTMRPDQISEALIESGMNEDHTGDLSKKLHENYVKKGKGDKRTKSQRLNGIRKTLVDEGFDKSTARTLADSIINMKTGVLLYYTEAEFNGIVESILSAEAEGNQPEYKEVKSRISNAWESNSTAPDIALFGRMLAENPGLNVDAACEMMHALSTHEVNTAEFDYFTAVDDLNTEEETGAGMLGLVAFNSATYYRFARIHWEQLLENLHGDVDLAQRTVDGFMKAFALVVPSGMKNSFVNQHAPDFLMAVARPGNDGQALVNAFEQPIKAKKGSGYAEKSVMALAEYWEQVEGAFRLRQPVLSVLNPRNYSLTEVSPEIDQASVPNLNAWVARILEPLSEGNA